MNKVPSVKRFTDSLFINFNTYTFANDFYDTLVVRSTHIAGWSSW